MLKFRIKEVVVKYRHFPDDILFYPQIESSRVVKRGIFGLGKSVLENYWSSFFQKGDPGKGGLLQLVPESDYNTVHFKTIEEANTFIADYGRSREKESKIYWANMAIDLQDDDPNVKIHLIN